MNDVYFVRLFDQMKAMIRVLNPKHGNIQEAIDIFERIRVHAKTHHQRDIQLAQFLGNFGELIFD